MNTTSVSILGIATISLLSLGMAIMLMRRWRQSPAGLFMGLCRVHKLRWSDRRLLWQLAAYHQIADPACIFVEPERFNPHGLPPRLAGRAARLAELRERLFYVPTAAATAAEKAVRRFASPSQPTPLFVVGQKRPTLG